MANLAFLKAKADTKRFVLQAGSRVFNPMGFFALYTVSVGILFQEIWNSGINGDNCLKIYEKNGKT